MKQATRLLLIFSIVLGCDFFFKAYVQSHIPLMSQSFPFYPYGGIGVFHNLLGIDFSINYVVNKGMAWGMFAQWQGALLCIRLLIIAGILFYLFFSSPKDSKRFPLTLVVAGAAGNVLDYFIYGHVIDMFHFRFWDYTYPIFNLADSAIFCGIALLFLQSFKLKRSFSSL